MPSYDYLCASCGPFRETRPMALSDAPCECPTCGVSAPRAILSAPRVLGMDPARRTALATNERSRNEPRSSRSLGGHGAGCACCSGGTKKGVFRADGAKTFPSARPWMISH